jgi:hypothetical protein
MQPAFYFDYLSQPCRTVGICLRLAEIPFDEVYVSFVNGGNRSDDMIDMNPLGTVPFVQFGDDLKMTEAVAIMRYLSSINPMIESLYPSDTIKRAHIDTALDWYHNNIRFPVVGMVFYSAVASFMPKDVSYYIAPCNKPLDSPLPSGNNKHIIEYSRALLMKSLDTIANVWLKTHDFVAGPDISIADILWCCELEQLSLLHENILSDTVVSWMQRVQTATNPHYNAVHKELRALCGKKSCNPHSFLTEFFLFCTRSVRGVERF